MPSTPPLIAVGLYSFQIGGSETLGSQIAALNRRRGYRVFCFAFYDSDGPIRRRLEAAGVDCLDLNYLRGPRGIRRLTYQARLTLLLRRRGVTAMHVHHTTALYLCGIPARVAGVHRLLMTEHAIHDMEGDPSYERGARFYCRFASRISVVHEKLLDYFVRDIGVARERMAIVPNGVAIPAAAPARAVGLRATHGVSATEFLFLFVGRLHPTKDLGVLLRAAALLKARSSQSFRLWLVGDGDERPMLEALRSELGLDDEVTLLGPTSTVSEFLAAADAFVMSSKTEGLPMALIEAMAHRVPCIATRVGGIPALFAHGTGLLAEPQSQIRWPHGCRNAWPIPAYAPGS